MVQYIKGRSGRHVQAEFAHLRKRYWSQHMCVRVYFRATVAQSHEATTKTFSKSHKWHENDQGFKITASAQPLNALLSGTAIADGFAAGTPDGNPVLLDHDRIKRPIPGNTTNSNQILAGREIHQIQFHREQGQTVLDVSVSRSGAERLSDFAQNLNIVRAGFTGEW
jgi:hypothetical protein